MVGRGGWKGWLVLGGGRRRLGGRVIGGCETVGRAMEGVQECKSRAVEDE